MTTPWTSIADEPDPDANRLGDAWDAIAAGHSPTVVAEDAELIALAGQLSSEATLIRPTLTFRNHLRETLMHTGPMPLTAVPPAPNVHPLPKLGRPVETDSSVPRAERAGGSRLQSIGIRWAAVAATIALLIGTAGGGYLGGLDVPGGGRGGTKLAAPVLGSPEAVSPEANLNDAGPCDPMERYFPCDANITVANGLIAGGLHPSSALDVSLVTMLSWEIDPGNGATFPSDDGFPAGIGMDIVIGGIYAATFSGPVTVTRPTGVDGAGGNGMTHEYPVAGSLIELSHGDAVSYELGSPVEIRNPLETQVLRFKRLLFHSEMIGLDIGDPVEGVFRVVADGESRMRTMLSDRPQKEFQILLTYVQIDPAYPLNRSNTVASVILGPVAPQFGGAPETQGYVVWIFDKIA